MKLSNSGPECAKGQWLVPNHFAQPSLKPSHTLRSLPPTELFPVPSIRWRVAKRLIRLHFVGFTLCHSDLHLSYRLCQIQNNFSDFTESPSRNGSRLVKGMWGWQQSLIIASEPETMAGSSKKELVFRAFRRVLEGSHNLFWHRQVIKAIQLLLFPSAH